MLTMSFANEEGSRQIQELTSLGRRIDKTRILFRSSRSLKSFNSNRQRPSFISGWQRLPYNSMVWPINRFCNSGKSGSW
jgi:hypothetical protein